jgi:Methyltransferase domain
VVTRDWVGWHRGYDDPESFLSRRLRVVQRELRRALDALPPGRIRLLSLCAGDGRDVIPVLAAHRRARDVSAVLVELEPRLVEVAVASAKAQSLLERVEVRCGDAGLLSLYRDSVPADLVLLCGIFGNVTEADIRSTVAAAASVLVAAGGYVIWTRGAKDVDLRPVIRAWFTESGFAEVIFQGEVDGFGVGVARLDRSSENSALKSERLFTFES